MKEATLVQMKRDIKNLTITLAIVIERLKELESKNNTDADTKEKTD